ncbi:MAG: hypothetical protein F6J93_02305 [Oscillatoria sp. SIO1A7]|nr:hypothetical protein [Oscillatoria sp. SIO1A7]
MKIPEWMKTPTQIGATALVLLGILLFFGLEFNLALAASIAAVCAGLSYKYPRGALWAFLIYMPFGGTVNYWVGNGDILFHLLYIPALVAIFQSYRQQNLPIPIARPLILPLWLLLGFCLLTFLAVNGYDQLVFQTGSNFLMGIVGLKTLLGYIPLILCAHYLIRSKQEFFFLTRLHVVLALICCGLGLLQYLFLSIGICAGTDHLSGEDLFRATLDYKCLVGGSLVFSPSQNMIRLPGTFVAHWQWSWFLIANAFFTLASALNDPSKPWRAVSWFAIASLWLATVVSGRGIATAFVPTVTLLLLLLLVNRKRAIWIEVGFASIIVMFGALYPGMLKERLDSFIPLWNAARDFILREFGFAIRENIGLLGLGLGRATNSARIFGDTILIETYYPKLLVEIGPLGVLAFLGLVTTLTVLTFKAWRSLRDKSLRGYGLCFWIFIFLISYNTYYYPLDINPIAVYYWLFVGVTFKLTELEEESSDRLL